MFKTPFLSVLLLAYLLGICQANSNGKADAATLRTIFGDIQPRFLWVKRDGQQQQQPIVIYQPQPNYDRHNHHHHPPPPYWPDYYPPPPYQQPYRPPGGQSYPSIVIVNPSNAQNLTFPQAAAAASTTTGTGTGTGGRSGLRNQAAIPLVDLLSSSILDDDSEVITAPENPTTDNDAPVTGAQLVEQAQPVAATQYGSDDRDDDLGEDEVALLERHAARGLTPKNLLSFLLQDKRRRRIQEAVAGIYLRNYNLNRK